jgi:hypothetical protein
MTCGKRSEAARTGRQRQELPAAKLDALIEEATVDAYGESEQTTGFYTMLEEYLAMPFQDRGARHGGHRRTPEFRTGQPTAH